MVPLKSDSKLIQHIRLAGLVHIYGEPGAGKTLLAIALAASLSRKAKVVWINADGKMSFIDSLKKTIDSNGGITSNVKVTIASNHKMAFEAIMALADTRLENSTLIVIDPVTRVLDMSRQNPAMWGQELIEEVLPTLAGLTNSDNGIFVVITSEVRQLSQDGNSPIHHRVIRRWSNKEYLVRRTPVGKQSEIVRIGDDVERIVGRLTLLEDGTVDLSVEVTIEGGVE